MRAESSIYDLGTWPWCHIVFPVLYEGGGLGAGL